MADSARLLMTQAYAAYARQSASDLQRAIDPLTHAAGLYEGAQDHRSQGAVLHNIGATYWNLQHADSALAYLEQALTIQYEVGDSTGEARTLDAIGGVHATTDRSELHPFMVAQCTST